MAQLVQLQMVRRPFRGRSYSLFRIPPRATAAAADLHLPPCSSSLSAADFSQPNSEVGQTETFVDWRRETMIKYYLMHINDYQNDYDDEVTSDFAGIVFSSLHHQTE